MVRLTLLLATSGSGCLRALPVSCNSVLSLWYIFETSNVEVEDRKFVLGEDVRVRLRFDSTPNITDGLLEILVDGWIKLALGVASNVDSALVVESSYTVNVVRVAAHDAVVEG